MKCATYIELDPASHSIAKGVSGIINNIASKFECINMFISYIYLTTIHELYIFYKPKNVKLWLITVFTTSGMRRGL
jgi:hypothetical protein